MADSVYCIVQPKGMGLPTTAYYATDEIREVPAHSPAPVRANCSLPRITETLSLRSTWKIV